MLFYSPASLDPLFYPLDSQCRQMIAKLRAGTSPVFRSRFKRIQTSKWKNADYLRIFSFSLTNHMPALIMKIPVRNQALKKNLSQIVNKTYADKHNNAGNNCCFSIFNKSKLAKQSAAQNVNRIKTCKFPVDVYACIFMEILRVCAAGISIGLRPPNTVKTKRAKSLLTET